MIIPGIFEKDLESIQKKVSLVDRQADLIQIDVADGVLVDGKTFADLEILDKLQTTSRLEVHLMAQNPAGYLLKLEIVSGICAQIEAHANIADFVNKSKRMGYRVGLSLNPKTKLDEVYPYMKDIDFVQLMAVSPGGQGRSFDPNVFSKIALLRKAIPGMLIQVDGGIDKQNLPLVLEAGADNVVVGSAVFGSEDPSAAFIELKGLIK